MTQISMMKKSAAALAALALLSIAPLQAQAQPDADAQARRNRIPVEDMRSYGATASVHNQRLMADVLRDFGYTSERLTARQRERLDDARYRLFPDQSPRQRLNRTQAIAVVYTALVYPRGTGGRGGQGDGRGGWDDGRGGWDDDRGRDRDWDRDRPRSGSRCTEIDEGVYALLNMVGGDGMSGFVNDQEKVAIRNKAAEVQRAAIARNHREVADRAADVIASLSEFMPQRHIVTEQVQGLKDATDQACGGR